MLTLLSSIGGMIISTKLHYFVFQGVAIISKAMFVGWLCVKKIETGSVLKYYICAV